MQILEGTDQDRSAVKTTLRVSQLQQKKNITVSHKKHLQSSKYARKINAVMHGVCYFHTSFPIFLLLGGEYHICII